VVFNWKCVKNYPNDDPFYRKYECCNYFTVDVFPDHIRLFNDFTVIPFCLNKAEKKFEIRTQLRSFIPLADPSKAVTYEYDPNSKDPSTVEHSTHTTA
jgi:hypothetical protein